MIQPYPTGPDCACDAAADDVHYHLDQIDDCVVVTAVGRIGADSLPPLLDAIDVATAFAHRVVIDLSRVTFLDRAGFDALSGALAWVRDPDDPEGADPSGHSGRSVSVVGPAGVVQMALEGARSRDTALVRDHVDDAEVALPHRSAG